MSENNAKFVSGNLNHMHKIVYLILLIENQLLEPF